MSRFDFARSPLDGRPDPVDQSRVYRFPDGERIELCPRPPWRKALRDIGIGLLIGLAIIAASASLAAYLIPPETW